MNRVVRWLFALLLLALPLPAWAWTRAETPHFRVYSNGPERRLVEQAALLEDFHALLIDRTGRGPTADAPPLDVFLVETLDDGSPWRRMPASVAGFYRADRGRISVIAVDKGDLPDSRTLTELTGRQILLHEYAHHFLLGTDGVAYPAWYVEGFAEYFSTARFLKDSIEIGRISGNRGIWLAGSEWLPMEQLLTRSPKFASSSDSAMFYAQSWLLTHYLFRTPGMRERLVAYLRATASGTDSVEAFRTHIDPDLKGFQQTLRAYLDRTTYSRMPRPARTEAAVQLRRMPPAADALLMRLVTLEHALPESRSAAALADVRTRAAQFPGDPLAGKALALAELQSGNREEARQMLERLLAASPDDPDLLRWRAMASGPGAAGFQDARTHLTRAFTAAPNDWRTLHAYARLFQPVRQPLPTHAMNALLRAHELAPQVSEVVLDTAVALTQAGRLPEAAVVLEPLAWSPHGGPAASFAQTLLQLARSGDRAGLLAAALEQQQKAQARSAAARARLPGA